MHVKNTLTILTIALTMNSSFGQALKTFNGAFSDGRLQNGNATYSYYEDPNSHEYLKQGAFKYTFKGQGDYTGYDQTITGAFDKGLRTGTWTYIITMTDFGKGNPYATGTISLTANYKNGYADGNWKEIRSYKNRKKYLVQGQYKWEPFEGLKTMSIIMNFSNGKLTGAVNINDEFAKFKAIGNYDANSLCIGTWVINDMGWGKNKELIFKDNILYEFIARSNSGEVESGTAKYQENYDNYLKATAMSPKEREESGLNVDTVCGGDLCAATSNIKEYFPKLFSVDYFLYEFIGGDLSFKEGFKGGCNIQVKAANYTALKSIEDFNKGDEYYNKKDFLKAYEFYKKVDSNKLKPSDKKILSDVINSINSKIPNILETYVNDSKYFEEYYKNQYDSLKLDQEYFTNLISVKKTGNYPGWDVMKYGKITNVVYNNSKCNQDYKIDKPWESPALGNPELYRGQTGYSDRVLICLNSNKAFYTPIQILVTESFFKYDIALQAEKVKILETKNDYSYNGKIYKMYAYDKIIFQGSIASAKKSYEMAKSLVDLESKSVNKNTQIETLNNANKKKTLFNKSQIVIKDCFLIVQENTDLLSQYDNLNKLNLFLDKVITLYSQDTKELESKLKEAETSEQIKTIILTK